MKELFKLDPIKIAGKTCSAVAGTIVVANNIYTISSKSDDGTKQPIAFYKNSKAIPIVTSSGSTSIARHVNSLAYLDHIFYIVTRNGTSENQIMGFTSDGIIKRKYKYTQSMIATLNHYKDDRFFISVNGGLSVKYRLIRMTSNSLLNTGIEFRCIIPESEYSTGNDSFYDKKTFKLYITKFKDSIHNAIYVYNLKSLVSGKKYYPEKILHYSGSEKFEIEGIGIKDGNLIACVNGVKNGKQADAIYQL